MGRQYFINGETMVKVNGQELGLTESPITISPTFQHLDIQVDSYGGRVPPEIQAMLGEVEVSMSLVHFDPSVLLQAVASALGGTTDGTMTHAGVTMGGNNNFLVLGIVSLVNNMAWRFPSAYLAQRPFSWPLGAERSVVQLTWRAIPYPVGGDPKTAVGAILWDHTAT